MNRLQVWAPNAQSVELVTQDRQSFSPPVILTPATITYRVHTISGYWQTPPGTSVLADRDGYWFKIVIENGETRYRIDPSARALNNDVSYSIYKDPGLFAWSDSGHRPTPLGQIVIYQLFQGAYVGRGDQNWVDRNGNNCHFEWNNKRKGNF